MKAPSTPLKGREIVNVNIGRLNMNSPTSIGAIARGPISLEPFIVAWFSAIPFSSKLRGSRFGISACPAGIWAARAEPFTKDRITRCHISMTPNTTKTESAMLCTRLTPNMTAMMLRLLNLSAR